MCSVRGASSSESSAAYGSNRLNLDIRKVNDSLYELHKTEGTPSMQVLFFHGLHSADHTNAHWKTWTSEDGSVVWPREWLVGEFPQAHIFAVSYIEGVRNLDMFLVGENLTTDLMDGNIGQVPFCPVILVGHCVGGLVVKKICLQARKKFLSGKASQSERKKLGMFLDNLQGIFYYGTPHRGSALIAQVEDGPLFNYFKVLNEKAVRLNSNFDDLRGSYPKWRVHGLGESLPTKLGLFQCIVAVPEASSREGEVFNVVEADHNSICQPRDKVDRRFYALRNLLSNIATKMEEEGKMREETRVQEACPQNFQHLPKEMISIDAQVQQVMGMLDNARILGLAGMGGLGKTTLAMALFNHLGSRFQYSCFVRDVKFIRGCEDSVEDIVHDQMHCDGKKVGGRSYLKGKKVLFVLDDISEREEKLLLKLAKDVALKSRFILTSRNQDLLRILGEVFVVPFWDNSAAEMLFRKHAFPNLEIPPKELESVMNSIIKKCDGLPLTLEVIGKYLRRKENCEDWKQTLNALEKAEDVKSFDERLWAKLRLSYDDLGPREQQMFLDATTFFSARRTWTLRDAKAAWSAAYETASERLLWQTLVDRSLVYSAEEDECIEVHEQLKSLGQRIALEPDNKSKYRVWDGELGLKILQTIKELDGKGIHSLQVDVQYNRFAYNHYVPLQRQRDVQFPIADIPRAALAKLQKLQFLETQEVGLPKYEKSLYSSSTIHNMVAAAELYWIQFLKAIDRATKKMNRPVTTELVLLHCVGRDLFNPALQTRLVVLKVSFLKDLPPSIGQLSVLKHLEMSCCSAQTLPKTFGQLKALQRLTLSSFPKLYSLPKSFGQLTTLNHLVFHRCSSLCTLPESFGQLKTLQHLEFSFCEELENLPKSFGELNSLNHLEFQKCYSLHTLPESFGELKALIYLRFKYCRDLHTLCECFGELKALNHLEFVGCHSLHTLPESFGQLKSLHYLEFYSCDELKSLPESFGGLNALNHLKLERCASLITLPKSFGQLSTLTHLDLGFTLLHDLPESFGQLTKLQMLVVFADIERWPNSLGDFTSLRDLTIGFYSATSIPDCIKGFLSLQRFVLLVLGDLVEPLPPWLITPNVPSSICKDSCLVFQVQGGRFFFLESESILRTK